MNYALICQIGTSFSCVLTSTDKVALGEIANLYKMESDMDKELNRTTSQERRSRKKTCSVTGTMAMPFEVTRSFDVVSEPSQDEQETHYHVVPAESLITEDADFLNLNLDPAVVQNLIETEQLLTVN